MAEEKKKTLRSVIFGDDTNNIVDNATTVGKFLTPSSQSEMKKRQQGDKGSIGATTGDNSGTGVNSSPQPSPAISQAIPTDNTYNIQKPQYSVSQEVNNNTKFKTFLPEQVGSGIGRGVGSNPESLQEATGKKTTFNYSDINGGRGTIVSDRTLSDSQLENIKNIASTPRTAPSQSPQYEGMGKREDLVNKLNSAISNDDQRSQAIYMKLLNNYDDNTTARIGQQINKDVAESRFDAQNQLFQQKFQNKNIEQQNALHNDTLKQLSTEFTKNPIFSPGQAGSVYKSRLGQLPDINTVKNLVNMSGKENMDKFNTILDSRDKNAIGKYLLQDAAFDPETVINFLDKMEQ